MVLKSSKDFNDKEFLKAIEDCCDDCDVCVVSKPPPLRPVVGMPLSDKFNQVVCVDLKEFVHNESWILHLIDSATRYSMACLVFSKQKDEIVENIYRMWIAYFGAPKKFLSDNGGEFSNDRYREMNEKLNVETMTTAGESPFSNGIVERHNQILAEAFRKTLSDVKCDPRVALAVSAKNTLQNSAGFSPNQLVFGFNPNFPTVLYDKLPAMEVSSSDIIQKNMNALHSARQNFIAAESSEKIRRALRHKVRTYADVIYENGDRVYYQRKNFKGWKGPAVVLGKDGQFVLVRHGGAYYRVHPCQLMKVKDVTDRSKSFIQVGVSPSENASEKTSVQIDESHKIVDEDDIGEDISTDESNSRAIGGSDGSGSPAASTNVAKDNTSKPSRNSFVRYKLDHEEEWNEAKVSSFQPKVTGKYTNWVNAHVVGEEDPICVN